MPGVVPVIEHGPETYEVTEAIVGGQLVEARAASKIGVAAAGSVKCLGVALNDGIAATAIDAATSGTNTYGMPFLDASVPDQYIAVGSRGVFVLAYAAAASFGDRLIVAALGKVTPAGATPDARTVVGICDEPAGVASAGPGKVRLNLG